MTFDARVGGASTETYASPWRSRNSNVSARSSSSSRPMPELYEGDERIDEITDARQLRLRLGRLDEARVVLEEDPLQLSGKLERLERGASPNATSCSASSCLVIVACAFTWKMNSGASAAPSGRSPRDRAGGRRASPPPRCRSARRSSRAALGDETPRGTSASAGPRLRAEADRRGHGRSVWPGWSWGQAPDPSRLDYLPFADDPARGGEPARGRVHARNRRDRSARCSGAAPAAGDVRSEEPLSLRNVNAPFADVRTVPSRFSGSNAGRRRSRRLRRPEPGRLASRPVPRRRRPCRPPRSRDTTRATVAGVAIVPPRWAGRAQSMQRIPTTAANTPLTVASTR